MSVINSNLNWGDDKRCPSKAYIFACLSELAYSSMGRCELRDNDRYRVIPSLLLQDLIKDDFKIHMDRVLGRLEIAATVLDTGAFIMIIFEFTQFTVIAIRGTTWRLSDWITDLDVRKVELNGLGYHGGFYGDAEIALPQLVTKVPADEHPVYFTGHSLGGALAGLLPQLWKGPGHVMTPYTFGSPRFGNRAVAENGKVYAYVRALDPVPHLPFKQMGFRSSGWPPCVIPTGDRWLSGWKLPKRWMELLPAHSIEQYRKEIGEE